MDQLRKYVRIIMEASLVEVNKKKEQEDMDIHLPELTMKRKDLIKYLKELYNIKLKD